jgi:hypothetical protein
MAFTFPDPSVSTTATNPDTGITYQYADGMWTPISTDAEEVELRTLEEEVDDLQDLDITSAISLLQTARQDIIELKSKVSSLELTSFLIME